MPIAELIPLALQTSIAVMACAVGMTATPRDLICVLENPRLLVRSLVSIFLVTLVAALAASRLLDLHRTVEIVIVALALSPMPPVLPNKQRTAGGDGSYAIGLVVAASLFSIVWVPPLMWIEGRMDDPLASMAPNSLASVVLFHLIAPLALGAVIRRIAPAFAIWMQPALARVGSLLQLAAVTPLLFNAWRPALQHIGGGTLLTLSAFVVIGLVSGHLLGGPDPDDRTVLALATASRHPGLAVSLAAIVFPQEKAVVVVVLMYFVILTLLSLPYVAWRKRVGSATIRDVERV